MDDMELRLGADLDLELALMPPPDIRSEEEAQLAMTYGTCAFCGSPRSKRLFTTVDEDGTLVWHMGMRCIRCEPEPS